MLANGVKQTTSTTGSGNLTLTAVTGYPKLSDAFPVGVLFSYALADSNGQFLEAGIGYLSDATTLVRSRVSATFNGTVYNSSNPTAASLTGTTTVIGTPHAATLESMLPTVDSISTSMLRYISTAGRTGNTTSVAVASLRANYVPFLLRVASPVNSLAINVSTAGAAATTARLGLYTCSQNGYPGTLLTSTGDIDTASVGFKVGTLSSPLMLPAGWYFTASVFSGGPTVTAQTAGGSNYIGGSPLGFATNMNPIDFRYESLASTTLPATAGANTTSSPGSNHIPFVLVGVP